MDQSIMKPPEESGIDLGRWMGRREAFGAIAGRCSAAEAQVLQRIREERAYLQVAGTWADFCEHHIGIHPRKVQRTLRLLEEFGPAYFHVAQMTHVTPDEYRAISAHVGEDGVRVDGAVVALLPENSEQVSAAVGELLRRTRPAPVRGSVTPAEAALKRVETAADSLAAAGTVFDTNQQLRLAHEVCRILEAARAQGVCLMKT